MVAIRNTGDMAVVLLPATKEVRERGAAVTGIAQSLAVGVAAAIEIHGPFAAACREDEQEMISVPSVS